jgi:hypothetical protein
MIEYFVWWMIWTDDKIAADDRGYGFFVLEETYPRIAV